MTADSVPNKNLPLFAKTSQRYIVLLGVGLGLILSGVSYLKFAYLQHGLGFEIAVGVAALLVLLFVFVMQKRGPAESTKSVSLQNSTTNSTTIVSTREHESPLSEATLSRRELEVLEGMYRGETNREIAEKLFLSPNTIKTHAASLYSKLGVNRRTQAVSRALELGIIGEKS